MKKQITKREKTILDLVVKGYSNQDIADELELCLPTIKTYLYWLFKKFKVKNRIQLLIAVKKIGG